MRNIQLHSIVCDKFIYVYFCIYILAMISHLCKPLSQVEINEKDGPGGGYGLVRWPADQTLRVGGQVCSVHVPLSHHQ